MKWAAIALAAVIALLVAAWLKLRGPDIPYPALETKYGDASTRFVDLANGFRVHYQDDGDPAAPPLVLLHGFGDSYTTWDGWTEALKGKFHILRPDFPGHGLTRAPVGYQLTGAGLADFIAEFAAALGLPPFAVAGNSMGGGAAWQLALRHPERINALILVDAAGWPAAPARGKIPLAFRILKYPIGRAFLRNIDNRPLIAEGLRVDVVDKTLITPAFVDRWAEFQRAPGHRAILMDLRLDGQSAATAQNLGTIRVPTLVINGAADVLVPATDAQKFAAAIPGARLILYSDVGHLPQIEIPARSAADVAAFLQAALPGPVSSDHGSTGLSR